MGFLWAIQLGFLPTRRIKRSRANVWFLYSSTTTSLLGLLRDPNDAVLLVGSNFMLDWVFAYVYWSVMSSLLLVCMLGWRNAHLLFLWKIGYFCCKNKLHMYSLLDVLYLLVWSLMKRCPQAEITNYGPPCVPTKRRDPKAYSLITTFLVVLSLEWRGPSTASNKNTYKFSTKKYCSFHCLLEKVSWRSPMICGHGLRLRYRHGCWTHISVYRHGDMAIYVHVLSYMYIQCIETYALGCYPLTEETKI